MEGDKMADQSDNLEKQNLPPRWAEFLIERMLRGVGCQTIVGDLREEYAETIRPRIGKARATLWYLQQVLSFVPHCAFELSCSSKFLGVVSLFTGGCGGWLAFMEHRLHHTGYLLRSGLDLLIILMSGLSIVAVGLWLDRVKYYLQIPAVASIVFAFRTIIVDIRSNHFEGFALIIAIGLMLQATLVLVSAKEDKDKFGEELSC